MGPKLRGGVGVGLAPRRRGSSPSRLKTPAALEVVLAPESRHRFHKARSVFQSLDQGFDFRATAPFDWSPRFTPQIRLIPYGQKTETVEKTVSRPIAA
jgi:hypothetical protein